MVTRKTSTKKQTVSSAKDNESAPQLMGLVRNDPYLEPFGDAIRGRHEYAVRKLEQLTQNGRQSLADFASGYDYYGLHKSETGWVFREWAPNATDIYLVGDFNGWTVNEQYRCKRVEGTDNWELELSEQKMKHGDLYKMRVFWNGGEGERIPAWAQRVVQDENTKIFPRRSGILKSHTNGSTRLSGPRYRLCLSMNVI